MECGMHDIMMMILVYANVIIIMMADSTLRLLGDWGSRPGEYFGSV